MRPLAAAAAVLALAGCGGASGSKGSTAPPPCAGAACQTAPPPQTPPDAIPSGDWPQYRRDVAGTSAPGTPLAAADAPRLAEAWATQVGPSTYAELVVAGDQAFVTTSEIASVVALAPATGAQRWKVDFDAATRADCAPKETHEGTWGSAAVVDGVVYAASPDGNVYALDAATGTGRWRAHVADPSPHGEVIGTSVVVSRALGRAYVGVASTAHCDQIPGRVAAIDLASGAVTERTLVPDGLRGAAVWATPTVDEAAGLLWIATGNAVAPSPDAAPDLSTEPLAQAIVALDARTLEPRASWQNPTSLVNADFGSSPTLFSAGGRDLVAATSKDGWLYVLDRANVAAGPAWKLQLAVVGGDGTSGGDPLAGYGSISAPAFADGTLYAAGGRTPAGEPGAIWALDPATGAVRWKHATAGPVLQPATPGAEVVAVVSAWNDAGNAVLELLDRRTGERLASLQGSSRSLSGVTFAAGRVYWAGFDGFVRALAPK